MNTFQAIEKRRSIRLYLNKPVELDDILIITEMGMHAPTSGDLQDIRFIVVRDKETIAKAAHLCMDQLWVTSAPVILVVCSQPNVQAQWYGERGRHVFATQNAAAAIQNCLLAATELGLSSCWVSGYNQEAMDDLFGTTGDARVEGIITLGYAAQGPEKKVINDHIKSVFFESYGNSKIDVDLLNKDYSKKIEKKLKEIDLQPQTFQDQAKKFMRNTKLKAKEVHKKYIVKKE